MLTIFWTNNDVWLTNNTFAQNLVKNDFTSYGGGAIYLDTALTDVALYNNIFWNNSAAYGADLLITDPTSTRISAFNNYFDRNKIADENEALVSPVTEADNIDFDRKDRLFVDPEMEDYHLLPDAVCVDAGTNTALGLLDHDFEGQTRIEDGNNNGMAVVDMGVDEYMFTCTGDIDRDKDVDGYDVTLFAGGLGDGITLEELAANYGRTGCPYELILTCPGDIDRDKDVDGFDVALLADGMGNGTTAEELAAHFGRTDCP